MLSIMDIKIPPFKVDHKCRMSRNSSIWLASEGLLGLSNDTPRSDFVQLSGRHARLPAIRLRTICTELEPKLRLAENV